MDKQALYDNIASRKFKPKDLEPYDGNNGRVNRCEKLIRSGKLASGGSLLDIGGGIGDLGYSVRDLFERRVIVDISSKNLSAATAKGNEAIVADIDEAGIPIKFANGFAGFTLVTALDFIEHIIDPENFARECFRVLRSGGHVFVNTPNIQYFQHLKTLLHEERFPHTSGDHEVFHGGHLAFFTYLDLQKIFLEAGFMGFEQIKDEEGFAQPPQSYVDLLKPRNQNHYVECCMRLGNPNLLFKAIKP
jgi:SAM-dependent methyltransferase